MANETKKKVYFIYADGCKSCAQMRNIIMSFGDAVELIDMECETDQAVDYAIANGISDIPACKIDDIVIQGEKFDARFLRKTIEERIG